MTIAIAASFTADPIEKSLAFWGRELGLAPSVSFAAYSQILQALFDPGSNLSTNTGGLNVVLLRVQDWLRELPDEQREAVGFLRTHLESTSRDLVEAMRGHRARARAATLLVLCPTSASMAASPAATLLHETEEALLAQLAGLPGLQVLRASDFHDALRGGRVAYRRCAARQDRPHPVHRRVLPCAWHDRGAACVAEGRRRRARSWSSTATTPCGAASSGEVGRRGHRVRRATPAAAGHARRGESQRRCRVPVLEERRGGRLARVRHAAGHAPEARARGGRHGELAAQVREHPRARDHAQPRARQLRLPRRQRRRVRRGQGRVPGGAHAGVASGCRGRAAPAGTHVGTRRAGQHDGGSHSAPRCTARNWAARACGTALAASATSSRASTSSSTSIRSPRRTSRAPRS